MERSENLTEWRKQQINAFAACIVDGIESWVKAGEIVAELLAADPDAIDDICTAIPGLQRDVVYRFEAIGRKEIHPRLLLSDAPGIKKLASMPYSVQEAYIDNPISVTVACNGNADVLLVKAESLTSDQCRQVFAKNHVRDAGEQRAWIESERQKKSIASESPEVLPYSVVGGKVTFRRNCTITKREMKQILSIM